MGKIISTNLSKQLGGKPNQRTKQRRGKNNVSQVPVVSEEDPYDVMVPKPMIAHGTSSTTRMTSPFM